MRRRGDSSSPSHMSLQKKKLFTLIVLFFICSAEASEAASSADRIVRINILSRHLRLLSEKKLDVIRFDFDGLITLKGDGETFRSFEIRFENGLRIITDNSVLFHPRQFFTVSGKKNALCTVTFGNTVRHYPLPLQFYFSSGTMRIVSSEKLNRYIYDSSAAEYGLRPKKYDEAIHALALLVGERFRFAKQGAFHRDSEFCDLTHCQVYRGRMTKMRLDRERHQWSLAPSSVPGPPLFHSRCGGHTLGGTVFSSTNHDLHGVRDWIADRGLYLCREAKSQWSRTVSGRELTEVLRKDKSMPGLFIPDTVLYDGACRVILRRGGEKQFSFSPEDFRLRVNRVKGWSFLKSNNYTVTARGGDDDREFVFSGMGLGHGVGLCQHGALALARLGYSRYEILEHYYPKISFKTEQGSSEKTPYLSYLIFSLANGSTEKISFPRFLKREIPPGSIFKILVALYLSHAREDLYNEYRYTCKGRSIDSSMPRRCWDPKGHGKNNLSSALSISCNLYFASLYKHINIVGFQDFLRELFKRIDINSDIPLVETKQDFAHFLSGLNFHMRFSVKDYVTLARFVSSGTSGSLRLEQARKYYAIDTLSSVHRALRDTVVSGTASGKLRPYGDSINYQSLSAAVHGGNRLPSCEQFWGKTSTVVDGTNRKYAYGMFMGACDDMGIVVMLRKGNGHVAAKWGLKLLDEACSR